jgi:hypothetical protein
MIMSTNIYSQQISVIHCPWVPPVRVLMEQYVQERMNLKANRIVRIMVKEVHQVMTFRIQTRGPKRSVITVTHNTKSENWRRK